MAYYQPTRIIASTSGRPGKDGISGGGAIVITSDTEPSTREDGTALVEGDFWWDSTDQILNIYIDGNWEVAGGQGILNTSDLPLASPTTTGFGSTPATLPDASNLATQEDANIWFLQALEDLDRRVTAGGGGGLGKLDFVGNDTEHPNNPIYAVQIPDQVTHYFSMRDLTMLEDANFFNARRLSRLRKRMRSLLKNDENGQYFATVAPMTVSVTGNEVLHDMKISDCNAITNTKVHRSASTLNTNAEVNGFTLIAESPVAVAVQDNTIVHGFQISDLNSLT